MKHRVWITLLAAVTALGGAGLAAAQEPHGNTVVDDGSDAPHGHGNAGNGGNVDPRFFTPPEDTAVDDATLPPGVLVVTLKDATDKPIARAPIALGVLHSTVAKGDSRERKLGETDENGVVRFEKLEIGSGHSYRVSTTRGQATYALPAVGLNDRGGKRAVLHAYETTDKIDDLAVAMQALVYVSLRDDTLQVEQLLNVYNLSPMAWTPDVPFELPQGFKAFNKQEAPGEARIDEVAGTGAALRGTFQPGRHDLDFRYQVPLASDDHQVLRIRLPPRVAQARVMAEASKSMGLVVEKFPPAQKTTSRDGKRLLVTELQATRGEGGVRELTITISGLPTRPGRWVALAIAAVVLVSGLVYFTQHKGGGIDDDTRGDLLEAREALLGEIVALERAFKTGEVGPKTYARVRASLVDALARIVSMLDEAKKAKIKPAPRAKPEPA